MDDAQTIVWKRSMRFRERVVITMYTLPGALAGVLLALLLPLSRSAVAFDAPGPDVGPRFVAPAPAAAASRPVDSTTVAPVEPVIVLEPVVIAVRPRSDARTGYGRRLRGRVAAVGQSCFVERRNGGRAVVDVHVRGGVIAQATPVVDGTGERVAACIASALVGETVPVPPGGGSAAVRLRFR
jgi:hypothetical protein